MPVQSNFQDWKTVTQKKKSDVQEHVGINFKQLLLMPDCDRIPDHIANHFPCLRKDIVHENAVLLYENNNDVKVFRNIMFDRKKGILIANLASILNNLWDKQPEKRALEYAKKSLGFIRALIQPDALNPLEIYIQSGKLPEPDIPDEESVDHIEEPRVEENTEETPAQDAASENVEQDATQTDEQNGGRSWASVVGGNDADFFPEDRLHINVDAAQDKEDDVSVRTPYVTENDPDVVVSAKEKNTQIGFRDSCLSAIDEELEKERKTVEILKLRLERAKLEKELLAAESS